MSNHLFTGAHTSADHIQAYFELKTLTRPRVFFHDVCSKNYRYMPKFEIPAPITAEWSTLFPRKGNRGQSAEGHNRISFGWSQVHHRQYNLIALARAAGSCLPWPVRNGYSGQFTNPQPATSFGLQSEHIRQRSLIAFRLLMSTALWPFLPNTLVRNIYPSENFF